MAAKHNPSDRGNRNKYTSVKKKKERKKEKEVKEERFPRTVHCVTAHPILAL